MTLRPSAGATVLLLACLAAPACSGTGRGAAPAPVSTAAPSSYSWRLPPGFPTPLEPGDNPMSEAKVELGRYLFYDTRLSGNESFSCASCHRQELAFTDGLPRSLGSTGEAHPRGAMSLANVAYSRTLNWADPTLVQLEDQADVPMFNRDPVELGLAGRERELEERLRGVELYRELFRRAFPDEGDPIRLDNVKKALASFERTLLSGGSAYDRLVFGGDREAFSEPAWSGMRLFFSERLRCFECHSGLTFSGPVVHRLAEVAEPEFHNTGLYAIGPEGSYPPRNRGVYEFTGSDEDMGRFKAPTLRNIALTAPYMHDGSLGSLEQVVEHYARGGRLISTRPHAGDGRDSPYKSDRIGGFELSAAEKADLVEFLGSLTDEDFVSDVRFSNPWD